MSKTLRLSVIAVMLLSSTALGIIAYNNLYPPPPPEPTPVVAPPPPEPAPTPVIIVRPPPPPPKVVYREVRSAVEEKYTKGVGIVGSSSKPYGVVGQAADRRNRDASGASDVVASDRNGNPHPKVYTIPANLRPGEEIKWMYDIAVLQSDGGSGQLYVQKTPYRWFANKDECMVDQTIRVADMEAERDKDGKINNWPSTRPIRAWRAITPSTVLTDTYKNSDYHYQSGYGSRAGGETNSDGSGSWRSGSNAGATADATSRSGTTQRVFRGMSQAYLPGDCVPKVVVKVSKPSTVLTEPDEMDLPEPPMTPPSKK